MYHDQLGVQAQLERIFIGIKMYYGSWDRNVSYIIYVSLILDAIGESDKGEESSIRTSGFQKSVRKKNVTLGKTTPDFQFSIHRMGLGGHLDLFKTRKEGM